MIYITGDVHYPIDVDKLYKLRDSGELKKTDTVIVCGDMGIVWGDYSMTRKRIADINSLGFTVCFVDGNHEHHNILAEMPCRKHFGARCHELAPNVLHLMRGRVYRIEDKTFFAMGGAQSYDKAIRHANIDWFPDEVPSVMDMRRGEDNLRVHDNTVDYIITHDAPFDIAKMLYARDTYQRYSLHDYFDTLLSEVTFKHWFCGHHHVDQDFGSVHILYNKVLQLTETGYSSVTF